MRAEGEPGKLVLPPESMDCGNQAGEAEAGDTGSQWALTGESGLAPCKSGLLIVRRGLGSEEVSLSGPRTWRKPAHRPWGNGKPIPWPVRVTTSLKALPDQTQNLSLLLEFPSLWVPSGSTHYSFPAKNSHHVRLPPWPASLQGSARHPGLE